MAPDQKGYHSNSKEGEDYGEVPVGHCSMPLLSKPFLFI